MPLGYPGFYRGDDRYTFTEWSFNDTNWVHRPVHSYVTGADTSVRFAETLLCYDYESTCGGGVIDLGNFTREVAVLQRDPVGGDREITRAENIYDDQTQRVQSTFRARWNG